MIVHCSGGIGRSGTFLAAFDAFIRLLNDPIDDRLVDPNGAINLKETVIYMRKTRHPWMVEGIHQYTLAYEIVASLIQDRIAKSA